MRGGTISLPAKMVPQDFIGFQHLAHSSCSININGRKDPETDPLGTPPADGVAQGIGDAHSQ